MKHENDTHDDGIVIFSALQLVPPSRPIALDFNGGAVGIVEHTAPFAAGSFIGHCLGGFRALQAQTRFAAIRRGITHDD